jgi:hypothetical protein
MSVNVSSRIAERRMRTSRRAQAAAASAFAAVAIMFAGACASGHSHRDGGGAVQMIVHVNNNLAPPADVTIYAVQQDGIRRLVGNAPPNKDVALRIPGDVLPGTQFRLIADRTGGRALPSQPISAASGVMIDWDLQTNALWFPEIGQ